MAGERRMNMAITRSVGGGGHAATLADLLEMHIESEDLPVPAEFSNLCLSLARVIDDAIANNEILVGARDLPLLLKKVLRHMNDSSLPAVFVLMSSVKSACKIGWFPDHDANDLLTLAEEIGRNFSTMEEINVQQSCILNVRKIMLRYYPRIKMGHVLASLEIKPGNGTFAADFNITRSMVCPAQKHISLFVAQTDNMNTSSCIVFPPQANFLLNGKGVQGRPKNSMDNGPQLPISVTTMIKYGKNLFQVAGRFDGNYVIVIAFVSKIPKSHTPELQDYVQPVSVSFDSDVIEGQARISLNCPISFKRIKVPVKGHTCKHYQCFDYDNFMEINSRRPSWRCPHCNQSVCNLDIRIDQKIVKLLKEVDENVVDVIISPDGSWMPVAESIDHAMQSNEQEDSEQCESVGLSNIPAHVVDLTKGEDEVNENPSSLESEVVKSLSCNLHEFSAAEKFLPSSVNYISSLPNPYFGALDPIVQPTRVGSLRNEHGMVGLIPNLGATPVMNKSRNIVHPSVRVQPVQIQHGNDSDQGRAQSSMLAPAGEERAKMFRMQPSIPVQFQPARTGTRFSHAMVAEQLRAAAAAAREERLNMMRGSPTGVADSTVVSRFMLPHPINLAPALASVMPGFWAFHNSSNDHYGMQSQADSQGRLRSTGDGAGGSDSSSEWTPWMP